LRQLNAELQASNESIASSRLAAVNVMQDAIDARREVERVNAELKTANEELAVFNEAAVGRELRMIELKEEINALCAALGQPPKYDVEFDQAQAQAS